ncbi:trigger factor [candidate division Kazan bacterium RBG_13_50_9]|uniref:Trigger factor n=1 Tax=candidate division Kazan bacterium RBG_13_50_9 TaxID=1798535 RepID=A0A1F4NSC3_UNCK3|nr:MAG: trigger factor [candidate division Kazan bacterium RBG_13_50_9]
MKTQVNKDKAKVKLEISLDAAEWQEVLAKAAESVSRSAEIKGFRKGKAPLEVIVSQVGETRVVSEATEVAINRFYAAALHEHGLVPLTAPNISVESVSIDSPLKFTAEITVMPEVSLGDYKKIRVKKHEIKIDQEQTEKVLKSFQRRAAEFKPIARAAKSGDWVEIDFMGKVDGKPFEGGESKNHPLIIGDGVFLPDFETALVGFKAGDEKTFTITFPKDYPQDKLAGKPVEFQVKLHQVKEVKLPPIDDELAKKSGPFATLAELRADVEKWAREEKTKMLRQQEQEEALEQLIKLTEVDVPDELVDQELSAMIHDLAHQLTHQNLTLADYLKKNDLTEEKLRGQWQPTAKKRVLAGLALNAFQRQEGIEATNEEVDEDIKRMQAMYPSEKDKIKEKYQSEAERRRLKHLLSGQKALERLSELATS